MDTPTEDKALTRAPDAATAPVEIQTRPAAPAPAAAQPRALGLVPTSVQDAFQLGRIAVASGATSAKTPEQATMIVLRAVELRVPVASALASFQVINGRVCMPADMQIALCKSRPDVCRYFRIVEETDDHVTWETHRVGEPEPQRGTFSLADAERAGLPARNDNWKKYPRRMCGRRAGAFLARDVYPDLLAGVYDPDEMREVERVAATIDVEAFEPARTPQATSDDAPLMRQLRACETPAELARLYGVIARMKLPESPLRTQLSAAYADAKRRVEAAALAAAAKTEVA